jgi:hypothetical protein
MMDLNGEEKRIQALFHEIKAEDEELAPPFSRTWNIVEGRFHRQPVSLRAALTFTRLITVALVIVSLVTVIVIRPWNSQHQPAVDTVVSTRKLVPVFESGVKATSQSGTSHRLNSQRRNMNTIAVRRFTGKKLMARSGSPQVRKIELSQWQSPTAGLLSFPGDELLKNSPALNQSAHEMRGFLSNLN